MSQSKNYPNLIKKIVKFFIVFFLMVLMGVFVRGRAVAQNSFERRNIVAVVPKNFPPQYSLSDEGRPTGFAIEAMDYVASYAGIEVTYLMKNPSLARNLKGQFLP